MLVLNSKRIVSIMSDSTRLKSTLYVGGLDNAVTSNTLHSAFVPFGEIADITLPKPQLPSAQDLHRGFAYVEFELEQDAKEAIDNMDQSVLFGRVIRVNVAKPQKDSVGEGLNSRTALWQQVSLLHKNSTRPSLEQWLGGLLGEACCE